MIKCKICEGEYANAKGLSYHTKVIHQMDYCDYLIEYEGYEKPKCKTCGKEIVYERNRGKGRTMGATGYFKKQFCGDICQKNNPEMRKIYSKAGKTGGANTWKGKKLSSEHKQKISKGVAEAYIDGFCYHKGKYTSTKTGQTHSFRSSWEKIYMEWLDENDDVLNWTYESFIIPYEYKGEQHRYLPDFTVLFYDKKVLVEVGVGDFKNSDPMALAKAEAAMRFIDEKDNDFHKYMIVDIRDL
jgi:hypothetical protein